MDSSIVGLPTFKQKFYFINQFLKFTRNSCYILNYFLGQNFQGFTKHSHTIHFLRNIFFIMERFYENFHHVHVLFNVV